jgi:hypothetical protein
MKCWEIIADNLKKAGWSLGYVSAVDLLGRHALFPLIPVLENIRVHDRTDPI